MITTNKIASLMTPDDGKRNVMSTSTMKPRPARAVQSAFPGVQARAINKVNPAVKFNTSELRDLMKSARVQHSGKVTLEVVPAPIIKTPQPQRAKRGGGRKKKV